MSTRWNLIVKTLDAPAAGIAGAVFIKAHGDKGSAKPVELGDAKKTGRSKRSPFSQNCTSHFAVVREDIGTLTSIEVWHTAPTPWGLEYVEIQKGEDAWVFKSMGDFIPPQKDDKIIAAVRLVGEYARVASGATKFHMAAKLGDIDVLKKMLQNNEFPVDAVDKLGRTAAHYAVLYGQINALELLIEFQADIGKRDSTGRHCLHHACVNHVNTIDVVQLLLENAPLIMDSMRDDDERKDVSENEKRVMKFIRDADMFKKNSMHYAATYGFTELIKLLHSRCSNSIHEKDNSQQTPLHCAAIQGQVDAALLLVDLGAYVSSVDWEDKTFLHHAAAIGHSKFISAVMEFDFPGTIKKNLLSVLEMPDIDGRTPFLCAASAGDEATLKALYKLGANVYQLDSDKSNVLHLASRKGEDSLLSYISQKIDVNSVNNYDFTPLHIASASGNFKAVRWLVKHGSSIDVVTMNGDNAAALARQGGHENVVRFLENTASLRVQEKNRTSRSNSVDRPGAPLLGAASSSGKPLSDPFANKPLIDDTPPPSKKSSKSEPTPAVVALQAENQKLLHTVNSLKDTLSQMQNTLREYENRYGNIDAQKNNEECIVS